jgi:hypothetical protein
VTSFGNIKNDAPLGTQHVMNPATWLSGVRPDLNISTPNMSATLDQVIAARVGVDTALPSLQVASETSPSAGNVGVYTTLSFRDATTPLRMEFSPREVFLQLFGPPDSSVVFKETASLLDHITEQTRILQRGLGPSDQAVLDRYLTSVREAERKLQASKREFGRM